MFDGKYFDWNQKRVKGIVDYYGYKFFYGKKLLDLGCGHADISGVLYRLGSEITAVDARQEHLKVVTKKFPGVKVVKGNLDGPWPFHGQNFDIILDLGLLCHLSSFEAHLKAVCASTTYLVLETAVCDSNDDNKCIQVPESKDVYDLSYNGMGCRPSVAAIERVLTACHMSFKRMDNSKYNSSEYVYDWQAKGDDSTNIHKRRIWFCTRNQPGVMLPESAGQQPAVVVAPPPHPSTFQVFNRNGIPTVLTAQARPPMSAIIAAAQTAPGSPPRDTARSQPLDLKPESLNFQAMKNSKEFSLIKPEEYGAPTTFDPTGIILPNSAATRSWITKIGPMYPNLMVSNQATTIIGFNKSKDPPTLVMCSVDRIVVCPRIWIEEWALGSLTDAHVNILKQCQVIMTPSLINAQAILKELPEANVQRVEKPWPMLPSDPIKYDYILYFEKDPKATKAILDSWDDRFGKIIVVGSALKLPDFAESVSNTADYKSITNLFMGAKAVLDISDNTYYMSGILKLARGYGLPIITNNQAFINQNNCIMINLGLSDGMIPNNDEIKKSIAKFIGESSKNPAKYDAAYNVELNNTVKKLLGV